MVGPGPEVVEEVARKLAGELGVLHSKVVESSNAGFRPPRWFALPESGGREVNGYGGQNGQIQQGQQTSQKTSERGTRAVSLPPVMPDHNSVQESPPEENMQQVEKQKQQVDETRRMDRELGGGQPQYQPYWYSPPSHTLSLVDADETVPNALSPKTSQSKTPAQPPTPISTNTPKRPVVSTTPMP